MKQSLLIAIVLIFTSSLMVNGQITITQADFPVPGTIWVELEDDRVGVHTLPTPGPAQTWDYSTEFQINDTMPLGFILPSSTPSAWAANFPNSNLALYDIPGNSAIYLKSQTDGIYLDGGYDNSGGQPITILDLDPDQLIYPAPFTYNGVRNHIAMFFVEQPASPPNPGILAKFYFIQNITCPAYGSVTTPAGTFPNVLLLRDFTYSIDSTFIDTSGNGNYIFFNSQGPSDTTITHSWLRNGLNSIVMEVFEDGNGVSDGALYYDPTLVGISEQNSLDDKISVYPNPSNSGTVNFDIDFDGAQSIKIFSLQGKLIKQYGIEGVNSFKMNTSAFNQGVYFYEISGKGLTPIRNKFIID